MMANSERVQPPSEIRRVFELLDNVNTAAERGDTFKFGMQVGKLIALGWVLGEVPSSDLSLHYDFDTWLRDVQAQEDSLRKQLGGLEKLLGDDQGE